LKNSLVHNLGNTIFNPEVMLVLQTDETEPCRSNFEELISKTDTSNNSHCAGVKSTHSCIHRETLTTQYTPSDLEQAFDEALKLPIA
jgi:hypothetical protein